MTIEQGAPATAGAPTGDQVLTIRVPAELHRQLKQKAADEDRSIAGIIRIAARQYLDAGDIT